MENKLQLFENEEFGKVRVLEIDGQPWFVGKDVADALGYERPTKAIQDHVDDEDKDGIPIRDSIGRKQNTPIINESGLYSLILSSKLPSARKFKRWVTSEILPAVRKHGAYITEETLEKVLESPFFATRLFKAIAEERKKTAEMEARVAELAPKARYYDTILQSHNAVPVSVISKDYGMSAASFNKLLHGFRIQYKVGETWLPYQPHAGQGYTRTRTYYISEDKTAVHSYWTQKGRFFIYDTLRKYGIVPLMEAHAASNGGCFHYMNIPHETVHASAQSGPL